jgi:hypothetical protein
VINELEPEKSLPIGGALEAAVQRNAHARSRRESLGDQAAAFDRKQSEADTGTCQRRFDSEGRLRWVFRSAAGHGGLIGSAIRLQPHDATRRWIE